MRVLGYRRFVAALAIGALAFTAAACGDDDDTGGGTTTTGDGGGEAQTIVVGHAYADLAAFADINPAFAIGDPEEQAQAVLEHIQTEGLLPEGVEIQLVQRAFDSLDRDDQAATCQAFADEDQVDVLLIGRLGNDVLECSAGRNGIPSISVDSPPAALLESAAPNAFSIRADESRVARNFIAWADAEGLLEGKTIGVYYDVRSGEAFEALREELQTRGFSVNSAVESNFVGVGSDQDTIAVQRFQTDGVDLALMMTGSTSVGNFQNFAQEQGYTPEYIDFEYGSHMSDIATLALSAEQYDGTRAVTSSRLGETADLGEAAQTCVEAWESFSGNDYPTEQPETGEMSNVLMTCDLFNTLVAALDNMADAGESFSPEAFVAGMEGIEDLELSYWDRVTFASDQHAGAHTQREVSFSADCQCFTTEGDFEDYEI